MQTSLTPCALAVGAAVLTLSTQAAAQTSATSTTPAVTVSATRIAMQDQDAPYASEVHTREDIERSGAATLLDFLAQNSSLQALPSFGNSYTPKISMRGYGDDGFQNIVISVNGRRLNNVDMVPQLIGAISLADIERIEITKGSGAVLFGDGATAGTIQIYTQAHDGASLHSYVGNHGQRGAVASVGVVKEKFELSATLDHDRKDGFSDRDPSGHTDQSEANTWGVTAAAKPVDGLRLELQAGASHIDTRYPSALTLAQFNQRPGMNTKKNYTQQKLETEHWSLGLDYQINAQWKVNARYHDEDKSSLYPSSGFNSDYRYKSHEVALQYQGQSLVLNAGWQGFKGTRTSAADDTTKHNQGLFVQGQYMLNNTTLSAGIRREKVEYDYSPVGAAGLHSQKRHTSWELGANHRISEQLSAFASYSSAFQTPDIDRFFTTDWSTGITTFNGFIEPAKARTLTLGATHDTGRNRLKAAVFYAKLKNEIYLEPMSYQNTNIDKSHKYGLELQERLTLTPTLAVSANYTWTQAKIDREADGAGAYNGKDLPGVPRHSIRLGLNAQVLDKGNLYLSHSWSSSTWASGDFDNNNLQRQKAYQSTDVTYRHQFAKNLDGYVSVNNLFARKNGIWVRDNAIYPINFARSVKVGARLQF